MEDKRIIWLASYPKSGNTWVRSLLAALTTGDVDINNLTINKIFSDKVILESELDLDADDLNELEVELFRKVAFSQLSGNAKKVQFVKIHDAFTFHSWAGEPLIPVNVSKLAVYIIRNPLDVSLSLSNHLGISPDQAIERYICAYNAKFLKGIKSMDQFPQYLGTWSLHVESWMNQTYFPVYFLRYEDMLSNPLESFSKVLNAIGFTFSSEEIQHAVNLCHFDKLKAQENKKGFAEKPSKANSFFHFGKSGRWKSDLSFNQIRNVMVINEKIMKLFGYWDDAEIFLSDSGFKFE